MAVNAVELLWSTSVPAGRTGILTQSPLPAGAAMVVLGTLRIFRLGRLSFTP